MIDLATNEAAFGAHRHYPRTFGLHLAVARELGVPADALTLTRGAEEAIALVYAAFAEAGDRTVKVAPTFGMVEVYERMHRAVPVDLSYRPDLSVPVEELLAALRSRARICYLANPNNMTGTMLSRSDLVAVLEAAREGGVYFVLDITYLAYASPYDSIRDLLDFARWPRLIVAVSFSKDHGLAGVRSGCALAAPAVIERLRKTQPMHELAAPAVEATLAALADPTVKRANIENAWRWRETFARALPDAVLPSEANFVLLRTARASALHAMLLRAGIRTRNVFDHPVMADIVRISIGPPAVMERVLDIARSVLCS
jgi:histidinol-phosphate aminotransferase